jgi:hypothetical protein
METYAGPIRECLYAFPAELLLFSNYSFPFTLSISRMRPERGVHSRRLNGEFGVLDILQTEIYVYI